MELRALHPGLAESWHTGWGGAAGNTCPSLAASAPKSLRSSWSPEEEATAAATKQEEVWPALGDRSLVPMVEQLFSHLLKVINICAHVLDDVTPGPAIKVLGAPAYTAGTRHTSAGSSALSLNERIAHVQAPQLALAKTAYFVPLLPGLCA